MGHKFSKKIKDKNEQLTGQQESTLPDPRKSPFFIKQLEKAKEFMKNNPVPVELLRTK
ncbi:hypothetical protein [Chitinophaga pinensis]|uniref:Uncharacterized protein n=1 Tax=Chitinophaga pinensis (strain ATCC 43595 / DSM 2588 / LMG 13176 / NBRC 15968 / NCIMB 11800 / UQM 2034) TaxID=485918 RepID=A0A979GM15_CHIPD|nr:hypothetical protein [Chitinophaga pinensis]ACU57607.1 hypothetical protein Cpin_0102 [Chitinophaga pinensis DSM 2588]